MRSRENMMFLVVIVSAFFAMLFRWCVVNFVGACIGETNTNPRKPPPNKKKTMNKYQQTHGKMHLLCRCSSFCSYLVALSCALYCGGVCFVLYVLGSALASLSVEARNYFLNKPNLQKLFPKSTLNWETIWNYFLNKPNLQKQFLKSNQFAETVS